MSDIKQEYIKVYCPKVKTYGMITTEKNNGLDQIVNFFEIDDDTAKKINTSHEGALPNVSMHLKPDAETGSRTPLVSDKTRHCSVGKGELWYQCLFCSGLQVCAETKKSKAIDVYFLMDESGSMSRADRINGANAVRTLVQDLQGAGNTYSFVPWGSNAGYLFCKETNPSAISSSLVAYEEDRTGYGGSTAADRAFAAIYNEVARSGNPVRIIFVTDGGFDSLPAAVRERDRLLRANPSAEILALGVPGAVQSNLDKISTVPSFSKVLGSSSELSTTFADIRKYLDEGNNN